MIEQARKRLTQLFTFLKSLDELRNPIRRQVSEYSWTLSWDQIPQRTEIRTLVVSASEGVGRGVELVEGEFVLTVKRPKKVPPPPYPPVLGVWVQSAWEDPTRSLGLIEDFVWSEEGLPLGLRPGGDPPGISSPQPTPGMDRWSRHLAWSGEGTPTGPSPIKVPPEMARAREDIARKLQPYFFARDGWRDEALKRRAVQDFFDRLFILWQRLEREGESFDLIYGDGLLNWRAPSGGINHPLILQKVRLEFIPDPAEFRFRVTGDDAELYTAPLRSTSVSGKTLSALEDRFGEMDIDPTREEGLDEFLRETAQTLHQNGEFLAWANIVGERDQLRVGRHPVLFARPRTRGFAHAIEGILDDIKDSEEIAPSLLRLVGHEGFPESDARDTTHYDDAYANENGTILFSKPANGAQLRIAQMVETTDSVVVWGPPGTGKTHTIANLIGHLLAEGKSVLVTSHTEKALSVVREKVDESLRPLCVSVLGKEDASHAQLEESVHTIGSKTAQGTLVEAELLVKRLEGDHKQMIQRVQELRKELEDACSDEYRHLFFKEEKHSPRDAAEWVKQGVGVHDWIPGIVSDDHHFSLTAGSLNRVHELGEMISPEDEQEANSILPDPMHLMPPRAFEDLSLQSLSLQGEAQQVAHHFWSPGIEPTTEELEQLVSEIERMASKLPELREGWFAEVFNDVIDGQKEHWEDLAALTAAIHEKAQGITRIQLDHEAILSREGDLPSTLAVLEQVHLHLEEGKTLGVWTRLTKKSWISVIEACSVDGKAPTTKEDVHALIRVGRVELERRRLSDRWRKQVQAKGGPPWHALGIPPEKQARKHTDKIVAIIQWRTTELPMLIERAKKLGFRWEEYVESRRRVVAKSEGDFHDEVLLKTVLEQIKARRSARKIPDLAEQLDSTKATLRAYQNKTKAKTVRLLIEAVDAESPADYREAIERLEYLTNLRPLVEERLDSISTLQTFAPDWAERYTSRKSKLLGPELDLAQAWKWRQLHNELTRRANRDTALIQRQLEGLRNDLQQCTSQLIEGKAWAALGRKITQAQRQALNSWFLAVKKIGKGTGKRAPIMRAEARRQMSLAKDAVPVWIMPLTRVVESFNPAKQRFDVLILDEASQLDCMGYLAFYLGRKVIVVGDDKQVSPEGVGVDLDQVQRLIDENLQGVPLANYYDPRTSVYDMAKACFGNALIQLTEHFRCAPEIIQFSNTYSYDGQIRPLRDTAASPFKPHVVELFVPGASEVRGQNELEAQTVANLLGALVEEPTYRGKTLGVVVMLGDSNSGQAAMIEQFVQQRLAPAEIIQRKLLIGAAPDFQGDERDIIVMSMVKAPQEGPLPKLTEERFQKRINVASSRAREQLWVVHSLDPRRDLKDGDLRRALIEHARDPGALMRRLAEGDGRTESDFEAKVFRALAGRGFKVHPQWRVGGTYRIDLVVEGLRENGTVHARLAIECDGEKFHGPEKLREDLARQAILERMGWTFIRIRGSLFYRNPELALAPLYQRLDEMGIVPMSDSMEEPESLDLIGRIRSMVFD